jgi:polyphosphate kinase 2 (PPK2 family)
MSIPTKHFRVDESAKVRLKDWPTRVKPFYSSKRDYEALLARHVEQLSKQQHLLYAHDRYSLLVVFQSMDAAGKDGAIKHVMSGVNPQGCQVFSFKHPSAEELDHDFLWRTSRSLPERGRIGIFNRSYYEEVLIVRVHPESGGAGGCAKDAVSGKNSGTTVQSSTSRKHLSQAAPWGCCTCRRSGSGGSSPGSAGGRN